MDENCVDEEGLISTSCIQIKNNKMFINNIEVEEVFELKKFIQLVKTDFYIWKNLKLKVQEKKNTCRSSAPIVNIPFDKAIELIISGKRSVSPRFRIDIEYSKDKIFGILFANFRKNNELIDFQLWQIYRLDDKTMDIPTNYIHGIYNSKENVFIHFDGALILHDENARQEIEKGCIPEKRYPYTKLFRLDCNIEKEIAKKMMNVYLPVEELNEEFGLKLTNL